MDELSQVDLAFCVDLTNSMAPFIMAAQRQMVVILGGLRSNARADLRVAVVGYRDHDPSPQYPPVEVHPFASEDADIQRTLRALRVWSGPGNTDAAEAVFAGLAAAMKDLEWRPHAFRVVVLIGDGPPHACGADDSPWPDRFPKEDPTGYSLGSLCNALEEAGLFIHALGMLPSTIPVHDHSLTRSFSRLAGTTGGTYRAAQDADAAIAVVEAIGRSVFGQMHFDREIFAALAAQANAMHAVSSTPMDVAARSSDAFGPPPAGAPPPAFAGPARLAAPAPGFAPPADLAASIGASAEEVEASLKRLKKRGILPGK